MPASTSTFRLSALALTALSLLQYVSAHASILGVHGANGIVGHGFGVDLYGKFPRKLGQVGAQGSRDAGGDVAVFPTGVKFPQPACGTSGELGVIDTAAGLSQQEGFGIPSAFPNGSVVMTIFQVNRDGGGPMQCEFSHDASLSDASWAPLVMTLNQAGNGGIQPQDRVNQTVVTTFPKNAMCSGGIYGDECIVRCRTGVDTKKNQRFKFGGCFAVKLAAHAGSSAPSGSSGPKTNNGMGSAGTGRSPVPTTGDVTLSNSQLNTIVNRVVRRMKKEGLVLKPHRRHD